MVLGAQDSRRVGPLGKGRLSSDELGLNKYPRSAEEMPESEVK